MNYAKLVMLNLFLSASVVLAQNNGKIDIRRGTPPWRGGCMYQVKNTYYMKLDNIVLDLKLKRKKRNLLVKWGLISKNKKHLKSDPFSGYYQCFLQYNTHSVTNISTRKGSAFREYEQSYFSFVPTGDGCMFVFDAKPNWWQKMWGLDGKKKINSDDVIKIGRRSDFMFREIYESDGKQLGIDNYYFIYWDQLDPFDARNKNSYLSVKRHNKNGISNPESERTKIMQVNSDWDRCTDNDLSYNVIQSEAKMMTYAIYGQSDVRRVGDSWTIDSDILTSFLPVGQDDRKPFHFKNGVIVLHLEKKENGIATIKMKPSDMINNINVSTDLQICPNTDSEFKPEFREPDLRDETNNFLIFEVDEEHKVCLRGEMQLVLEDYSGAIPNVQQFVLKGKPTDRDKVEATIEAGKVTISASLETELLGDN